MRPEVKKLGRCSRSDGEMIRTTCVNIANYAMMIADNAERSGKDAE